MDPDTIARIIPAISPTRFERYHLTGTSEQDAFVNYLWNIALSESLFPCLNVVEVALRNSIAAALAEQFGTAAWYTLNGVLDDEQAKAVALVMERIRRYGKDLTPGRVISELTFGFWVTLLSRTYDARLWRAGQAAALKAAFPRVPKRYRQRQQIHQRYNIIRQLRNRVFHYEPIFDDPDLQHRHQQIIEAVNWINPTMGDILRGVDRFPLIYADVRVQLESRLGRG